MAIPYTLKNPLDPKAEPISLDFPSSFADLTFRQFYRYWTEIHFEEDPDPLTMLEILTGVSAETWSACTPANLEAVITERLKFLYSPPKLDELPVPKTVTVNGKTLHVPEDLEEEAFGQVLYLRGKVNKYAGKPHDFLEIVPHAAAAYLFTEYYGRALDSKTMRREFFDLVLNAKLLEVYPVGRFFFMSLLNTHKRKVKSSPLSIRTTNSPPGLRSSKSLARSQRSTLLRKVARWIGKKCSSSRRK